ILPNQSFQKSRLSRARLSDDVHVRPAVGSLDAESFPFIPKVGLAKIGNAVIEVSGHVSIIFRNSRSSKAQSLIQCGKFHILARLRFLPNLRGEFWFFPNQSLEKSGGGRKRKLCTAPKYARISFHAFIGKPRSRA